MPFSIYQATCGAPFPINQTICQELRVDGGIAQPGLLNEDTHTSLALVSCLSRLKPRYCRGCVVVDRSSQLTRTELGHTHFSSACFSPVLLESPLLSVMCSLRQIFTTQVLGAPLLLQQQVLGTCPFSNKNILAPTFPAFPVIKIIFLEYVCVKFFKIKLKESFSHKAPMAFNCRFKI
jgi:hypothetical protein